MPGWATPTVTGCCSASASATPLIDAQPGMSWERPLATTRAYLDAMDEAGIPVDARCVAALGPKMLELARTGRPAPTRTS